MAIPIKNTILAMSALWFFCALQFVFAAPYTVSLYFKNAPPANSQAQFMTSCFGACKFLGAAALCAIAHNANEHSVRILACGFATTALASAYVFASYASVITSISWAWPAAYAAFAAVCFMSARELAPSGSKKS